MKLIKLIVLAALAGVLTACGGGGGSAGTTTTGSGNTSSGTSTTPGTDTATAVTTPAAIDVFASKNEVLSSGAEITITAVVKNLNNVGMAKQPVVFSVSGSATLRGPSVETDADGIATARLSSGSSKALRDVTVTVTSGASAGSVTLPVTGTRLTLTGATEIKLSDSTTFVARLQDSDGAPIASGTVSVSSSLGNVLNTTTLVTSPAGEVQFIYTANKSGTDTITVSSLGVSSRAIVGISDIDFVVTSPGPGSGVIVNVPQTITVRYRNGGNAVVGQSVQFSTTRGILSNSSAVTNANGEASITVSSPSAGPATVLAQVVGAGQISLPLNFVATVPASLVLQANPSAILPNSDGSSTNQSIIEAKVQDASGNAVAGRQVDFSILADDGNGGNFNISNAVTDANGRAQVQFVPGAQSTSTSGVKLQANIAGTSISGTTALTVNGQALFISIAFGNTISNLDETAYSKSFSVYVTDANGNAVANQRISLASLPLTYGKGFLDWGGSSWLVDLGATPPIGARTICPNEDINRNGELDPGDDLDGDGRLKPGNPTVVVPGSVVTNSQGRATFALEYGEQYVPWLTVELVASASVGGTESRSSLVYPLVGLASDFQDEGVTPAGLVSPFGSTQSCTSP